MSAFSFFISCEVYFVGFGAACGRAKTHKIL